MWSRIDTPFVIKIQICIYIYTALCEQKMSHLCRILTLAVKFGSNDVLPKYSMCCLQNTSFMFVWRLKQTLSQQYTSTFEEKLLCTATI